MTDAEILAHDATALTKPSIIREFAQAACRSHDLTVSTAARAKLGTAWRSNRAIFLFYAHAINDIGACEDQWRAEAA